MAQPSTSHQLTSCANQSLRYGSLPHRSYSDRLLGAGQWFVMSWYPTSFHVRVSPSSGTLRF
jgi:hypothetical protein